MSIAADLRKQIQSCNRCALAALMPEGCFPVPGRGSVKSSVMFVGEALGEDESYAGEPFVGRCGKFLSNQLELANIDRKKLFITNAVKCRPIENGKNRPPTDNEIAKCKIWLWKEIQLVKPELIVTLGKVPTYTLLNSKLKKSFKLKDVVGTRYSMIFDTIETTVIPQYHPSFLMVHGKKMVEEALDIFKGIAYEKITIDRKTG